MQFGPLPASYPTTREALRAVATYVIAPALRQATGRIRLQPTPGGVGTAAFGEGRRIRIEAAAGQTALVVDDGATVERFPLTTVRDLAAAVGVEPSADPGVGHDLVAFAPDVPLAVDPSAAEAVADWFAFGEAVLGDLRHALAVRGPVSDLVLWPEHFDLGFQLDGDGLRPANYGVSPGDGAHEEPYLYVGPWDLSITAGPGADGLWNAPFGALLSWSELAVVPSPADHARAWFERRITALAV